MKKKLQYAYRAAHHAAGYAGRSAKYIRVSMLSTARAQIYDYT